MTNLERIKNSMVEFGWHMDDGVDEFKAFKDYLDIHLCELEQQFDAMSESGTTDRVIDIASLGFVIDVLRALKEQEHE